MTTRRPNSAQPPSAIAPLPMPRHSCSHHPLVPHPSAVPCEHCMHAHMHARVCVANAVCPAHMSVQCVGAWNLCHMSVHAVLLCVQSVHVCIHACDHAPMNKLLPECARLCVCVCARVGAGKVRWRPPGHSGVRGVGSCMRAKSSIGLGTRVGHRRGFLHRPEVTILDSPSELSCVSNCRWLSHILRAISWPARCLDIGCGGTHLRRFLGAVVPT